MRRQPGWITAPSRRLRPSLDRLEDRTTPSTFYVTNALDSRVPTPGSLRWAITQANLPQNQGSTVAITPEVQGTIVLRGGELKISSSVTIENDSGHALTIQAGPNSRIFHVLLNPRTTSVTIRGQDAASTLTLTGGRVLNQNGGAILVDNPYNALSLSYVNVVGNTAAQVRFPKSGKNGSGGGIYARGTVALDHSSVTSNVALGPTSASGLGGGVYADWGITLNASHVDSNSARNYGGIINVFGPINILNRSTVDGNSSIGNAAATGDYGGGGVAAIAGSVTVSASEVSHNRALGMFSGGIVLLLGGATITDGSHVDDNSNNGPGGGIAANFGGAVVVTRGSTVNGNTGAGLGGGIVNFSERFSITVSDHSQVDNNTLTNGEDAAVTGGLLAAVGPGFLSGGRGDATLLTAMVQFTSVITERAALIQQADAAFPSGGNTQVGGGIASALTGPVIITGGSEVSGNRFAKTVQNLAAVGVGGGVFNNLGSILIDGSTVADNVATGDGGGIWSGQSLTLNNSSVLRNRSATRGGGIFNRGTFSNTNSTIANNTPDNVYPAS